MANFTKSAQRILQGFGAAGTRYSSVDNVITDTASTTDTHIAPSPGLSSGYIRLRTKSVNAATTTQVYFKLDDGTTTVCVRPLMTATSAGDAIDWLIPFCLDIAATQLTVIFTLAGATKTLTYDLEVVGNQ